MHDLRTCPVDRVTQLIIVERNGIEIDYCPACRGVWLDRGELEKILDGAAQVTAQAVQRAAQTPQQPTVDPLMPPPTAYPQQPPQPRQPMPQQGYQQHPPAYQAQAPYGYNNSGHWQDGRRKKRGWLDDIFDFD